VKHLALGLQGAGHEDALLHLLNYLWPNIYEKSPHVIGAVFEAVEALRVSLGPGIILAYLRAVFSGGVLIAYCMWAFSSASANGDGAIWYQMSIVQFAVAILRYALLLEQGKGAEPENLVLSDRALLLAGGAWLLIYGIAIYTS
jgi:hypothetical protein